VRENHVHEARALSSNRRFLGFEHTVALILARRRAGRRLFRPAPVYLDASGRARLPAWITDVQSDPNYPRVEAAIEAGLHAAFCFPIRTARGVVGAIEFMTSNLQEPDDELLATTESLGS
jgi:hypothetical protein